MLLAEFEKRLLSQGIDEIILLTLRDPRTKGFYQKKGYTVLEEMMLMNKTIKKKRHNG